MKRLTDALARIEELENKSMEIAVENKRLREQLNEIAKLTQQAQELRAENNKLKVQMSEIGQCDITGLIRRSPYVLDEISRMQNHADHNDEKLVILMIDMDDLKSINDTYGHATGDLALKEFVISVKQHMRLSDRLYRWGGDEFLAILPIKGLPDDKKKMELFIERIQKNIRSNPLRIGGIEIPLSASFGLIFMDLKKPVLEEIEKADALMYEQKKKRKQENEE